MIKLHHVHKEFQIGSQTVYALKDIHQEIPVASTVAITGRSGGGKSTLLHIAGTLDTPTRGEVYIDGFKVSDMNDKRLSQFRNRQIGFVFQSNNLLPEFSALENVMMPGLIGNVHFKNLKKRAKELLVEVGLNERFCHRPSELSGGEQQRVAIARALVMNPRIILADEPTGNLDVKTGLLVLDLLLKICNRYNVTMLLVTHDLEVARRLPQKIVMEDGMIVRDYFANIKKK